VLLSPLCTASLFPPETSSEQTNCIVLSNPSIGCSTITSFNFPASPGDLVGFRWRFECYSDVLSEFQMSLNIQQPESDQNALAFPIPILPQDVSWTCASSGENATQCISPSGAGNMTANFGSCNIGTVLTFTFQMTIPQQALERGKPYIIAASTFATGRYQISNIGRGSTFVNRYAIGESVSVCSDEYESCIASTGMKSCCSRREGFVCKRHATSPFCSGNSSASLSEVDEIHRCVKV
jgi:hypothetical protein